MCDEADWCQGWSFDEAKSCRLYLGKNEAVHPVNQWCAATQERTDGLFTCNSQLAEPASAEPIYLLAASNQSCSSFCVAKNMQCALKARRPCKV